MADHSLFQLVEAVKAHAEEHYEDGWDVIVEFYGTDELEDLLARELLGRPHTPESAIYQIALALDLNSPKGI
jgi:hypothetical protein